MGALTGATISTTYDTLLKTATTGGITSSLKVIEDGLGDDSALKLSDTIVGVNGSLGVGLDAPEYILHAQSSDENVGKFESTDAEASIILEDNGSTTDGNRITVTSDALSIATANVTALTVDGSQRVGIGGTPAGSGQLDVLSSNTNITPSSVAGAGISLRNTHATDDNYSFIRFDSSGGNITSGIFGVTTNQTSSYGELSFATVGSGGFAEAMRIDSSGVVKLNQVDESEIAFRRNNTGAMDCGKITFGDNTDARAQIQGETTTASDDGELTFSTADNGTLAERMRIDSNGYVGIGTSSPFTSLHIDRPQAGVATLDFEDVSQAAIYIPAANTSSYYQPLIGVGENATTFTAAISSFDDGTGGAQGLAFHTGDTNAITERMRIDSNGYVGIGTAAPIGLLSLESEGDNFLQFELTGTGANVWSVGMDNNDGNFKIIDGAAGDTPALTIDTSGNVIVASMPTSDPAIAGALWSDSGTVKISAG